MEKDKSHVDIEIEFPLINDALNSKWDYECDKSFLIGIYKHGNF